MKSQARIIPDLYQQDQAIKKVNVEENKSAEEDDGRETMFETIHKFTEGRRAYKKKIISDVMAAAYPNMEGIRLANECLNLIVSDLCQRQMHKKKLWLNMCVLLSLLYQISMWTNLWKGARCCPRLTNVFGV